jgi:hypothetical protein
MEETHIASFNDLATDPDAASDRLLRLLADVSPKFGLERSWRITRRTLLTNRYLLSTDMPSFGHAAGRTIVDLCRQLDMPAEFLGIIVFHLPVTRFVHFGFEASVGKCWYKVYLEFAAAPDSTAPILQHLAFKWDASGSGQSVVTRYVRYPVSSINELFSRLAHTQAPGASAEPLEIAQEVVMLASRRIAPRRLQYLEVREDGIDRRSYDLNLYDSALWISDLHALLVRMCAHHEIAPEILDAYYEPIRSERAGHLAGGTHRDGTDFFTVYFGAGRWRGPDQVSGHAALSSVTRS